MGIINHIQKQVQMTTPLMTKYDFKLRKVKQKKITEKKYQKKKIKKKFKIKETL